MTVTLESSPALTTQQARMLQFILDYTLEHGYQPAYREILAHFGWANPNAVASHMMRLARKGYVAEPQGSKAGGGYHCRAIRILRLPDGTPFRGFTLK